MSHEHSHQHSHTINAESLNKAFIIGIVLNLAFVVIEFAAGFWFNSLALLSDAGHNLSDVVSLVLALLAFRLAKIKANEHYTYGYKKSTILVSLLNAVILLVAVGAIVIESIHKLSNPAVVPGGAIAWVAGVGVLINAFTAFLFMKDKEKDLNVKGAYLHMAADALVSVGVLVAGIVISRTGWYIIDPIIGLIVAVVILISTWDLLHDSLRLTLDGVPASIDSQKVVEAIRVLPGVDDVHHIHIWAISTTENALTAHIVLKQPEGM
jgi:cation diffusion facilitator family transporter